MSKLQDRLDNAYYFARCKFIECGIDYGNISEVKVNTRMTSTWGTCGYEKYSSDWSKCVYSINISARLLRDDVSEEALMDTLMHEILHTCFGCMNHGARWKKLASVFNAKYGMHIKRCTTSAEKNIKEKPIQYKYAIKCTNCGKTYYRQKLVRSVQHPEFYRCGVCNHSLVRVM